MDANAIAQQVPELDTLFYHGLIDRLKQRRELAKLTQHPASTNIGENMAHLQAMFNAAKNAEHEVNQLVAMTMGSNFRRQPIGGDNQVAGRAFSATLSNSQSFLNSSQGGTPTRGTQGIIRAGSYTTSASQGSGVETFALTMLSNAEKALRDSSNTNAPDRKSVV